MVAGFQLRLSPKSVRREIASALKLKHRFLVEAYDAGQIDDADFLVMEYVPGGTVARRIEHGDYDDGMALRWCAQLLESLRYLHECGWIHRDMKPNNLLFSATEDLKISDLRYREGRLRRGVLDSIWRSDWLDPIHFAASAPKPD